MASSPPPRRSAFNASRRGLTVTPSPPASMRRRHGDAAFGRGRQTPRHRRYPGRDEGPQGRREAPGRLVLGCDQVLEFDGKIFANPKPPTGAAITAAAAAGQVTQRFSAVVAYEDAEPIWRHVARRG
jgi:hypothetical protein